MISTIPPSRGRLPIGFAAMLLGLGLAFPAFAQDGDDVAGADPQSEAQVDPAPVLRNAVDDFIRPGYGDLASGADAMATAIGALCEIPSEDALSAARDRFGQTVEAWSAVETIRFGPIMEDNAAERIFFYPDRRGIGLRQVQAALAEKDASVTDPQTLRAKSVALQGLGTLEFLLHGSGAEALATNEDGDENGEGAFRCRFAEAVAETVTATAQTVREGWAEAGERFAEPDAAHSDFKTADDSLRALIGVFTNGLELIGDTRLAPIITAEDGSIAPRGSAWYRSGLSTRALAANLDGLQRLFEQSRIGDLATGIHSNTPSEIDFEFTNAGRTLGQILDAAPAANEAQAQRFTYVRLVVGSLRNLFANRFAAAIGQRSGFSSLDGD